MRRRALPAIVPFAMFGLPGWALGVWNPPTSVGEAILHVALMTAGCLIGDWLPRRIGR